MYTVTLSAGSLLVLGMLAGAVATVVIILFAAAIYSKKKK